LLTKIRIIRAIPNGKYRIPTENSDINERVKSTADADQTRIVFRL